MSIRLSTSSRRFAASASLYWSGMSVLLNPALYRLPRHQKLLGGMILGYTELEITFSHTAGLVLGLTFEVLHALEKVYSETGKIKVIHALTKAAFQRANLNEEYHTALKMITYCAEVRNRYAHCQFQQNFQKRGRLEFVEGPDLFKGASVGSKADDLPWRHLSLKLLQEQEAYFVETRKWLMYLEMKLQERAAGKIFEERNGRPRKLTVWTKPRQMQQPPADSLPPPRPRVQTKKSPGGKRSKPA